MSEQRVQSRAGAALFFARLGRLGCLLWGLFLLETFLGVAQPLYAQTSTQETPYVTSLKKAQQYLKDGFCPDALRIASDLAAREGSRKDYRVWYVMVQAHYCRYDLVKVFATMDELRRNVVPEPDQQAELTAFREQIEESFGRLQLFLPTSQGSKVSLEISPIGPLGKPELQPFFEVAKKRLTAGVEVPGAPLYLPYGAYLVDMSEVVIESFEGVTYRVGREAPSKRKLSQMGGGQAFGVGVIGFVGFDGATVSVQQSENAMQTFVSEERLPYNWTGVFDLSTTHNFRAGTLGLVGVKSWVRFHPENGATAALAGDPESRVKRKASYASLGSGLHLARTYFGDWMFQGGFGFHVEGINQVEYLAYAKETANSSTYVSRVPVYLPSWGGGVELGATAGKSVSAGKTGVQFGADLRLGLSALFPHDNVEEGEPVDVSVDGATTTISYYLYDEYLWGTYGALTVYFRVLFF